MLANFIFMWFYKIMKITNLQSLPFKSTFTVDTGSATSKPQIFTLGALMGSGWIYNANTTFNRIKNSGVYTRIDIRVKDNKDDNFEAVLKKNKIEYEKHLDASFDRIV